MQVRIASRTAVCAAVSLVTFCALSACSVMERAGSGPSSPPPAPVSPEYKNAKAKNMALAGGNDLVKSECSSTEAGVWAFKGVLRNSTDKRSHYTVSVSVANRDTGVLFGTASQTFAVERNKEVQISIPEVADSGAADRSQIACANLVTVVRDS